MQAEGDPRVGTPGALPYRWGRSAPEQEADAAGPSTPDLMSELRARTLEAMGPPAGGEPAGEAPADPVVQLPLVLVQRLVAALAEARLALAEHHGEPRGRAGAAEPPGAADVEMARMVVLNMALNGAPRHEAELYLARNFALGDPAAVVADAYECVPDMLSPAPPSGAPEAGGPDHDRQAP